MSRPERFPELKPERGNADREEMAIDSMQNPQLTAGPPAAVTHIGVVPEESIAEPVVLEEVAELRRRLETERSASCALLAAMRELEQRVEAERTERGVQQVTMGELWAQIAALNEALVMAERPLWRKLLRHA